MGCNQSKSIRSRPSAATPAVTSTTSELKAPESAMPHVTLAEQQTVMECHRADDVKLPVSSETAAAVVVEEEIVPVPASNVAEPGVVAVKPESLEDVVTSETTQSQALSSLSAAEPPAGGVSQASPLAQRGCNEANITDGQVTAAPAACFSDYLAQHAVGKSKKVVFDAETMRKTAPHGHQPTASAANLTRKQKDMIKKKHVSSGRRGPVASKWDKGGKSHMQTELYLEMAAAFERMLTNAETINAHLDSR